MRRALALLALCAIPAFSAFAQAADAETPDWFHIGAEASAFWDVATDPKDESRVLLRRRGATGPARRIMVIYPRGSSAYDTAMTTLLTEFANRPLPLEFLVANFGDDPARGEPLLDEAAARGDALIYAMGSETVAWLHARGRDPEIPTVTVCAKDPVLLGQAPDYGGAGGNIAFTSLNVQIEVQVEYLRKLKPALKSVAILVDARNLSAVETQSRPIAEALNAVGVDAFEVAVAGPETARADLVRLMPEALARMRAADPELKDSLFWITGSTSVFSELDLIDAQAGPVPVLAAVPEVVRAGTESAALSIGVSFESNAQLAAVYGASILEGEATPADLPVGLVSPPDIAVNFRAARRTGLRIPFAFFESASFVYGPEGEPERLRGAEVSPGFPPPARN